MRRTTSFCAGIVLTCRLAFGQAADLSKDRQALKDPDANTRIAAVTALGDKGPVAIPDLVECLREDKHAGVRVAASAALAKMGEAAVPAIVDILEKDAPEEPFAPKKKGEGRTQRSATVFARRAVQALSPEVKAKSAIPALAQLMAKKKPTDFAWQNAAEALVAIGPKANDALDAACEKEFGTIGKQVADLIRTDDPKRIAALNELEEKGAAAGKAVPYMVDCMPDSNDAVRQAAINALAKVGADAVPAMLEQFELANYRSITVDTSTRGTDLVVAAMAVLDKLDPQVKVKTAIPALAALLAQQKGNTDARDNAIEALGRIGPEALPVLAAALEREGALDDLVEKVGPAAKPVVGRLLDKLAGTPLTNVSQRWEVCNALAAIPPDAKDAKVLADLIRNDQFGMVQDLGMVLDRIGPSSVPVLVELLADKDWYPRWGATMALEMMGPKASAAMPALENAFKNDEDIDVRVGAARAIASIQGTDPFSLYGQIPKMRERLIETARAKSVARRQEFMKLELARLTTVTEDSTQARWQRTTGYVYALMTGEGAAAANAGLKAAAESGDVGNFMDVNLIRAFMLFYSKSEFYPGRLAADTEAAMKKYYFDKLNREPGTSERGQLRWKVSTKTLKAGEPFAVMSHGNGPLNYGTRDYLSLSVLKDDPAYKDRKFTDGDTVTERYQAWNDHFKQYLKDWSLQGLWMEIGSSYEYHTYASIFNLADLAPDPIVRQRAKMYLDLCLVEAQQMSITGLRAGSKARAKKGGEGSVFNAYLHMLFGERGRLMVHSQIAVSPYQPPEAALLMHKLGPSTPVYSIANRQSGEINHQDKEGQLVLKNSHMVNYAHSTPEYVMGCSMWDPNRAYTHACEGRWSGVVFRDRAIISLPGYTGEKWNVQSKDVMVTQRCEGAYYTGIARMDFTSGFEKVERDGWLFVDNGEAYAAVKAVVGGYTWTDPVKGSFDLNDQSSPIIIQTGRAKDYKTFTQFQDAILKAPLKLEYAAGDKKQLEKVEYTGPNSSKVEFFTQTKPFLLPKVDGKPIDLELEYNYLSPYMENQKGSDVVTIRFGDKSWKYDFGKNTVTEQ